MLGLLALLTRVSLYPQLFALKAPMLILHCKAQPLSVVSDSEDVLRSRKYTQSGCLLQQPGAMSEWEQVA